MDWICIVLDLDLQLDFDLDWTRMWIWIVIGLAWLCLAWLGLQWIGLDWIEMDWIGFGLGLDLDRTGFGLDLDWMCIGLDWIWTWVGLGWIGTMEHEIHMSTMIRWYVCTHLTGKPHSAPPPRTGQPQHHQRSDASHGENASASTGRHRRRDAAADRSGVGW